MGFDYSNAANTALRQIADKGRLVQLVYKTQGSYDPQSDTRTGDGEDTENIKALFTQYRQSEIDGTVIQQGDQRVLIAAKDITKPKLGDILIDTDTTEFTIKNVDEVKPGDTVLLYRLQVRR